jgi:hypothetical protein
MDLVGQPERKNPLGRTRCNWKDNIKSYFRKLEEVLWTGFFWLRIRSSGGLF